MSDWQNLELDEIAEWPLLPQCVMALLLALVLIMVVGWYWLIPLQDELGQLKNRESELHSQLVYRANQIAAMPEVKEQVAALRSRYQKVIKQLPEESELANLLAAVNDIGVRNGLVFQRIEWAPRVGHSLYYELPMNIELTGEYEYIGEFVASVANLSRIVTLNDFELRLTGQQGTLSLKVLAKTYRFKAPEVKEQ
ncbi:Type IV pilus biogenesis protein PilO [Photobacterium marinum]|uniref:Type IV pilus biogenesis protein PilO n=1 Tax=Photobacterium marinum TaxID=1056511 RepID=L8J8Q6_9GAMM|nr:type 4a pilus biogenesis protein PilO [Photobacterium marinum]ELR63939.1 Type IV pilus biogenesis protein PilO [Photobacterium marinum]